MAKLYFRYGTVSSAKTLNLLAVAHNYRQQGKKVLLVKPAFDTRFGAGVIKSRAGLEMQADCLVPNYGTLFVMPDLTDVVCVLVDEAQFLTSNDIDVLHKCVHVAPKIPVICYGLRTDFRRQLFPASARLLAIADSIEEIKTICALCSRHKAVFNLKRRPDGAAVLDGPSVELGLDDKYLPVCGCCYNVAIGDAQ